MPGALRAASWPTDSLPDAMTTLAQRAGLAAERVDPVIVSQAAEADEEDGPRLVDWIAERLGLEAEAVRVTPASVDAFLRGGAPALLRYRDGREFRLLLLVGSKRGRVRLMGPTMRTHACPIATVVDALCGASDASLGPEIDSVLEIARVSTRRKARVRSLLARQRLADVEVADAWCLRLPPTASFRALLNEAGVPRRLVRMLTVFALLYAIEIVGWSTIGAAALDGRLDAGWLAAWVLLVVSMIPFQLVARWLDATLALDVSRLIKTRLLLGALRFDPDGLRRQGVGQLLGRVLESQAFESVALNSGLGSVVVGLQILFAGWVLSRGAAPALHLTLLVAWVAIGASICGAYGRRLSSWTADRLAMTHALIERMVGHQTTLAQESPQRRDAEEDAATARYLKASERLDAAAVPFLLGVPSGWLVVALLAIAPTFVSGDATSSELAISLGGIVMAGRAFVAFAGGLSGAAAAVVAWRQIGPLFAAGAATPGGGPSPPFICSRDIRASAHARSVALVDAEGLSYRYGDREQPALRGASLTIRHGERLLVQGPSGGGKSTLASLLVGLRQPDTGLLCLNGLDRHTVGSTWHRIVAGAPQFHENHLLSGPLAFNLLMGRQWPPSDRDLVDAGEICAELGLGPLVERMPAGLMQQVGETGWQLSHGERSRVFLARALLQDAELTVLDESFGALDPESLETCLAAAMRRSKTLAVVAHP